MRSTFMVGLKKVVKKRLMDPKMARKKAFIEAMENTGADPDTTEPSLETKVIFPIRSREKKHCSNPL